MSSKAFTKKVFDWLHQVNRDPRVPNAVTAVALELSSYFNEDDNDGRAWPSSKRIGDAMHLHETNVLRAIQRLAAAGHLHVVWGKQGKGYTNQYWMKLKPAPTQVNAEPKPAPTQVLKPAPAQTKPAPAQENHSNNHLKRKRGGRTPPPRWGFCTQGQCRCSPKHRTGQGTSTSHPSHPRPLHLAAGATSGAATQQQTCLAKVDG